MPLITDPAETRELLALLQSRHAAMPCFCTENRWTTEAILCAARAAGEKFGLPAPPVIVGFTSGYPGRSNMNNYMACADRALGLEAILSDLKLLTSKDSPYGECRVLPALDHGQPDADSRLLEEHADRFAMVMFDASALPFEENLERTADYVSRMSGRVVVEGAVDELKEAAQGGGAFGLTTVEQAERFVSETGCDLIVPNVGTEHRAAEAGKAQYHGERAREIAAAVGPRLVLHGTSCLGRSDVSMLPKDGIVKVNIWTIIEVRGAEAVVEHVRENAGRMVAPELLEGMQTSGDAAGPQLDTFPLVNLKRRWVDKVSGELAHYFEMFGYGRLAE